MKKFLMLMLFLHVLIEAVAGGLLVFHPTIFIAEPDPANLPFMISLGGAAITMALVVVWFWPYRNNPAALSITLGVLATYHTAVTCTGIMAKLMGGPSDAIIIHGVFAACFWYFWFNRQKLAVD